MSLENINWNALSGKCGICGVSLKSMEITDQEETDRTGEWVTKWSYGYCKNHNPIIQYVKDVSKRLQTVEFVRKINDEKITIKRKTKFFLANKDNLGVTRY